MKVLVTGGSGFIGSHVAVDLLEQGSEVVVLDNLENSSYETIARIESLTTSNVNFVKGDVRDTDFVRSVLSEQEIDAVIHLAARKSVAESVRLPLSYYETNVAGTLSLLRAMSDQGIYRLVFSSSATVYGIPEFTPIPETHPVGRAASPYGRSKFFIEETLKDLAGADGRWSIAILRYFNPAGAHSSGAIGESPQGIPNNLLPILSRVALGRLPKVAVYGGDYPTVDGTGVRDYLHVCDLARGHVQALEFISEKNGVHVWNMGTGRGYSVLEVLKAFQDVCGKAIPYEISSRRSGDVAECYADVSKAERELGWRSDKGIERMVEDAWRWQSLNPDA
ncbi:UDP-glucose 4-epimerase [compost metagenome]